MEIQHMRYSGKRNQTRLRSILFGKKLFISLEIILLVVFGIYTYLALTKPLPPLKETTVKISSSATTPLIPWPAGIDSAFGSLDEGTLAQSSKTEQPRSIASIAKVITALAVITKKPITNITDNVITFTHADEDLYNYYVSVGGSTVPINTGDQLSEYYALEAMMVPSANNIADSLAVWAFGSISSYNDYANSLVKSLGMYNTSVGEASGFNDTVLSTPSDLIILGKYYLKNKFLSQIVRVKDDTLPELGIVIHNTNTLLSTSVDGIKTGHTASAGYCLLLDKVIPVNNKKTLRVLSAILGADNAADSFVLSDMLIENVKNNFADNIIIAKGITVGSFTSAWGSKSDVITEMPLTEFGWKNKSRTAVVNLDSLSISNKNPKYVGTVKIVNSVDESSNVKLLLKNHIYPPSIWWRFTNYF